jgi:hypothetical protein
MLRRNRIGSLRRPPRPCLVRNRLTGRWLSVPETLSWSTDRDDAHRYPSSAVARDHVRACGGGPIPIVIEPA